MAGQRFIFSRNLSFALAALLALTYWFLCVQEFVAERLSASSAPNDILRAATLDPGDANRHFWVGRYRLHVENDVSGAIVELQRAAALNPGVGRIWLDLALAQLAAGSTDQARASAERALTAASHDLETVLGAGHFYLAAGDPAKAFQLYRIAVTADPTMTASVTDQVWRSSRDAHAVLEQVLPNEPAARRQFFAYLLSDGDLNAADVVWRSTVSHRDIPEQSPSLQFTENLLQAGRSDDAARVWADLAELTPEMKRAQQPGNLVFNPDFQSPFLNRGFDWIVTPRAGIDWSLGAAQGAVGSQALQGDFNCQNTAFLALSQRVILEPGKVYVFRARVSSKELLSAGPPHIAILDPVTRNEIAAGPEIVPQSTWTDYTFHFTAPENFKLGLIALVRSNPETRIKGTLWIDQVRLAQVPL